MKIYRLNFIHGSLQITLSVEHLVCGDIAHLINDLSKLIREVQPCQPHLDIIREQPEEDRLSGVGHEALSLEGRFLQEPRQSPSVVEMKVRDEKEIDIVSRDHVNKGQSVHPSQAWVDPTVQHDLLVLKGDDVTGPTDLLPGPHGGDLHEIRLLRGRQGRYRHDRFHWVVLWFKSSEILHSDAIVPLLKILLKI